MTGQTYACPRDTSIRKPASQDRRVLRTRKAIREGLLDMLGTTDLSKITVTALARAAAVDRKTFYLHYRTVEEVLEDIAALRSEAVIADLREAVRKGEITDANSLFVKLATLLAQTYALDDAVISHIPLELLLSRMDAPLIRALLEEDTFGISRAMGDYFEYGVAYFSAGLLAVFGRWTANGRQEPVEELGAAVALVVTSGIEGVLARDTAAPQPR